MYRIPKELDISFATGQSTSQLCIGQNDFQFGLGDVHFAVQSPIKLTKAGKEIGAWSEGRWPDPSFYDVMNVEVTNIDVPNDRQIVICLENGIHMHLLDDSDQYECMTISVKGTGMKWII